jgi:catechol 2,3-dioxygenase-like lactoylglutathione lyase family enzyme
MAGGKLPFRLVALTIACTDKGRSARFYQEVLGADPLPREDGIGCPWYRLGPLALTLMPNAAQRSPATFPRHAMPMLWLEVDDLEAASRRFRREGVEVIRPSDGLFMLIADPDGLVIEVWQAEGNGDPP